MAKDYDIVIVGAGLIGSTLGLWLTKYTQLSVAVVERESRLTKNASPNQRVVALGSTATTLLTDVGIFQGLGPESSHPYSTMVVWDEHSNGELVVAADGARSWIRQQAKIFANHRDYQQLGIVARIQTEKSHENCAWQRFLSSGPLAVLPLSENQSSIVWSATNDRASELLQLTELEFCDALSEALQRRLGSVELLSERQAFPLRSQRAERYYTKNIVLLGDAAHSVHPLAGQGANLGFKDVACLGDLLAQSSRLELGNLPLLARYERARKNDNEQTDTLMSALDLIYRDRSTTGALLRGLGMKMVNSSLMFRRLLALQAMGLR